MCESQFEFYFNEAEVAEVSNYKPRRAAELYQYALNAAATPQQRFRCMRKLGVCHQLLHEWDNCMWWHDQALGLAQTEVNITDADIANTRIDRSQGCRGKGDFESAKKDLEEALRVFDPIKHLERFAVACQFYGHVLLDMGRPMRAVTYLELAVTALSRTAAQHDQLYALLRLSIAYAVYGQKMKSRTTALKALLLTRHVGSKAHAVRAVLLIAGDQLRRKTEPRLRRFME